MKLIKNKKVYVCSAHDSWDSLDNKYVFRYLVSKEWADRLQRYLATGIRINE